MLSTTLFTVAAAAAAATTTLVSAAPLVRREQPVSSCATSYTVVSGDVCYGIIGRYGIKLEELYQLNPQINRDCTDLQIADVLCISKDKSLGVSASAFTAASTTDVSAPQTTQDAAPSSTIPVTPSSTADPVVVEQATTSVAQAEAVVYNAPTPAAVQETTVAAAPAVAQAAAVSTPSSGSHTGHATYYFQNGNPGACGAYNNDDAMIIAAPYSVWNNGAICGKSLTIQRGSQTIQAVVADLCPTCTDEFGIDLSHGAFTQIATEAEGYVEVNWWFN